MKTVYSTENCPACLVLKTKLKAVGEPFMEVVIGRDIPRDIFFLRYPDARSVPFVVDDEA